MSRRVLALLLPAILAFAGTAHAQLEFFSKVADLSNGAKILEVLNKVATGQFYQVGYKGTIDTEGETVFGQNGSSIPIVAYVVVDTSESIGPKVEYALGASDGNGSTLGSPFIGYREDQIIAIYVRFGTYETAYLRNPYLSLAPLLAVTALDDLVLGSSLPAPANLWLDDDLDSGSPDFGWFQLTDGMKFFRFDIGNDSESVLDLTAAIQIYDDSLFAFGDVTEFTIEDLSAAAADFLGDTNGLKKAIKRTELKLKKAKAKAKSRGIRPNKYAAYKKLQKKFKKYKAQLKRLDPSDPLGDEFELE